MEKILALVLALVYGVWYMSAQPAPQAANKVVTASVNSVQVTQEKSNLEVEVAVVEEESEVIQLHMTQEAMHHSIKSSCENAGWIVTEFKNNALIAEKIDTDGTISTTVKFDGSSFELLPENSELKAIISANFINSDSKH